MWLSIRDAAGNVLGQEDLIHTGWTVTERGFINSDVITIVVERSGLMADGFLSYDQGGASVAVVKSPGGEAEQGQELDFQAGAFIIFNKGD
jgi:hypothetical protein